MNRGALRFFTFAIICLALATPGADARADNLVVKTHQGTIQGIAEFGIDSFLGIPYAQPPVGALRWMPPKPAQKFVGTFQATNFGNFCTQPGTSSSEDCLTLNVFRPTTAAPPAGKSKLPVMIWIHGGGLTTGGSFPYDPSPLVIAGNLIVVTINYRLGLLGFFAHPAIDAEKHSHGNYGLMDQQLAMKWVHSNIGAFGGDPKRVTIFGESAGGQSIYSNLASPAAHGLFQRAIAESGSYSQFQSYFDSIIVPLAAAEKSGTPFVPSGIALANAAGCGSTATAACLRGVSADTLVGIEPGIVYPFIDGKVLERTLTQAFTGGNFNQVPVIAGTNHDEWRAFVPQSLTDSEYPAAVAALVGMPVDSIVVQALLDNDYPLSNYPPPPGEMSAPLALGAFGTDLIFACPARNADQLLSKFVPTYAYEFNDENAPGPVSSFPLGAYHAAELSYLFDIFERFSGTDPFTADQQKLSDAMISYWTQFAATGNPNSSAQPAWPKYDAATDQFLSLIPPTPATESTFDAEHQCSTLWNTI